MAWINNAKGMWHPPSLLPTTSCRNWRHVRPAGSARWCTGSSASCQNASAFGDNARAGTMSHLHGLTFSFPLLQEKRYQPTAVYAVTVWSLLAKVSFVLMQQWCELFLHILAAFGNCLGTSLFLVAQYMWSHQKSLTCVNIKNISKIRSFNILNIQDFPNLCWCQ